MTLKDVDFCQHFGTLQSVVEKQLVYLRRGKDGTVYCLFTPAFYFVILALVLASLNHNRTFYCTTNL